MVSWNKGFSREFDSSSGLAHWLYLCWVFGETPEFERGPNMPSLKLPSTSIIMVLQFCCLEAILCE
jgi:hypothetical protein